MEIEEQQKKVGEHIDRLFSLIIDNCSLDEEEIAHALKFNDYVKIRVIDCIFGFELECNREKLKCTPLIKKQEKKKIEERVNILSTCLENEIKSIFNIILEAHNIKEESVQCEYNTRYNYIIKELEIFEQSAMDSKVFSTKTKKIMVRSSHH